MSKKSKQNYEQLLDNVSSRSELKKLNKKYKANGKKRRKKLPWVLLTIFLLIGLPSSYFAYTFTQALNGKATPSIIPFTQSAKAKEDNTIPDVKRPKVETFNGVTSANGANNILIFGQDEAAGNSDSIMILQLDGPSGKPKLLSIARDTLVRIPGTDGLQKINAAYALGAQTNEGAELLRETIAQNFGIDLKYYATVNFTTFAEVIDALFPDKLAVNAKFATIDGQAVNSVEVPDDLNAQKDEYGNIINIPTQTINQGEQKMDGRTLLNYARFRHDDDNDFGRMKRQQQVLSILMKELQNPATILRLGTAAGTALKYVATDVPNDFIIKQATHLATAGGNFEKLTVPQPDTYQDQLDIYGGSGLKITDSQGTMDAINSFLEQQ
ncbi:MAG: LCP family protein [Streptococcaceae bacterium]|jgi:anionic cell wall polymer biosynthesis LytR-Cps2A-Psr (LCP) family protein|nr:LCP family protein [Streptococcaceae bacterium]